MKNRSRCSLNTLSVTQSVLRFYSSLKSDGRIFFEIFLHELLLWRLGQNAQFQRRRQGRVDELKLGTWLQNQVVSAP